MDRGPRPLGPRWEGLPPNGQWYMGEGGSVVQDHHKRGVKGILSLGMDVGQQVGGASGDRRSGEGVREGGREKRGGNQVRKREAKNCACVGGGEVGGRESGRNGQRKGGTGVKPNLGEKTRAEQ